MKTLLGGCTLLNKEWVARACMAVDARGRKNSFQLGFLGEDYLRLCGEFRWVDRIWGISAGFGAEELRAGPMDCLGCPKCRLVEAVCP